MPNANRFVSSVLFTLLCCGGWQFAAAADWSRFRGPDGRGVGEGQPVPTEWSETENLKWKTALPGAGSSSPISWGDRVFVTCYSGYGEGGGSVESLARHVVCVRLSDGEIEWTKTIPSESRDDPYQGFLTEHGYASNTPVTDGDRLYVFLAKSGVHVYSLDGDELWQADLGRGSSDREWGSAASPVLYGDTVIVNASEESRSVRALNKATGDEMWKINVPELCYNTPTLGKSASGRDELIVPTPGEVWSINPATGKLRWYAEVPIPRNVSPSAVIGDGMVYVYGGRPGGAAAIRMDGRGDVTDTHTVWTTTRDSSYVATPLLHGGHLYWASDRGIAFCVNAATGETVENRRLNVRSGGRPFYASPVLSGDSIIIPSRYDGVFVFSADPSFEQLGVNRFESDDSLVNATPAIVDGQLLLRSDTHLYCVAAE